MEDCALAVFCDPEAVVDGEAGGVGAVTLVPTAIWSPVVNSSAVPKEFEGTSPIMTDPASDALMTSAFWRLPGV